MEIFGLILFIALIYIGIVYTFIGFLAIYKDE
jgi:hypothetical protein